MNNPTIFTKGKVLGDLLVKTHLSVNAKITDAATGTPVELGSPLVVSASSEGGYEATKAPANEANGILLETTEDSSKEVSVLIHGEIKSNFYDTPLSQELRTDLLKNGIVLK